MRGIVFFVVAYLASIAIAHAYDRGGANAAAAAAAGAAASATQAQGQVQGQAQRQSMRTTQRQANQQSVTMNEARQSGAAPTIGLGGFASGSCVGTTTQAGVGVGIPGGASVGIGGGRSEIDDECTRRETARMLLMLGQRDLAVKLMLDAPHVRALRARDTDAATADARHPGCAGSLVNRDSDWFKANCL